MGFEATFVTLFAVATAVALLARWIKVPYTVALVAAGLALSSATRFEAPHLTQDLLFAVFLPGLLFEAAFQLDLKKLRRNTIAITTLAVPGVVAGALLTAALLVPTTRALAVADGFSLGAALVFGALIAATDPIAVVALFRSLGAPKRLSLLVDAESLLNDGTSVVLFSIIVAAVGGGQISIAAAVLAFFKVVGLGVVVGLAVGAAASKVIQRVDDPMIEITLTVIAAYGSFAVAESVHASGVIATVIAGIWCGSYAMTTGMSPTTRVAVRSFWEYVAFALNSVVFLLIGATVHMDQLLRSWKAILVAYAIVTTVRAVLIFGVSGGLRFTRERIPWSWSAILTWGGLRGALSMVLVLGLPLGFAHRELLVTMTFGVVMLTIVVQGLTMKPLLRRLGVVDGQADRESYEVARGAARAASAALEALRRMAGEKLIHADVRDALEAEYVQKIETAEAEIKNLHLEKAELRDEELRRARRQLLVVERDDLATSLHRGLIGAPAYERLLKDLASRIAACEGTAEPGDE